MEVEEARTFFAEHNPGDYLLLDVRQPAEYQEGHIPGARLIPLPELADRLDELDQDKPVFAY
jgi:rhodanese-related sulfurtransferase